MSYMSQLAAMRELIQTELVPLVIYEIDTPEEHGERWACKLCGLATEKAKAPTKLLAKHSTFCKLGNALSVTE